MNMMHEHELHLYAAKQVHGGRGHPILMLVLLIASSTVCGGAGAGAHLESTAGELAEVQEQGCTFIIVHFQLFSPK